ncbi:Xaa-Pro dipeptidase [Agaribacter flavus]|uniref:Xaa-Pro dipeptidase n=1 Tax=Agaribacter flavus TaxID=1902781 RepID=A0ABV7FYI0_9ALTE
MDNDSIKTLYAKHIDIMQARAKEAIEREGIEGLIIHSGQLHYQFLDDNPYPFKVNPHFKSWLPVVDNPNSWLIIDGENKPKLVFYLPVDFWHKVPEVPDAFWVPFFDIHYLKKANKVEQCLPYDLSKYAYLGEHLEVAKALGMHLLNPDRVLHYLHYHRAYKTDYELYCMRKANSIAVKAHKVAKQSFFSGLSEYEINQEYLGVAKQSENDMPYGNIVALNENASILHYMLLNKAPPSTHRSFLIDAGASYHGYAADITRTYSMEDNRFQELIVAVDSLTEYLVSQVTPGKEYLSLHEAACGGIAKILSEFGVVNLLPDDIVEQGIVSTFFPHGIGHMLGLQVHDVAGHVADDTGTAKPAPSAHPFLRCMRTIEARQVFTVEPGIYFIDSLLTELKGSENSKYINWNTVDAFKPFGGIRIEDNVIVHSEHTENMTRELWEESLS